MFGGFWMVIDASHEGSASRILSTAFDGTRNALEFAASHKTRKFLMVSSGAVYGPQPAAVSHLEMLGITNLSKVPLRLVTFTGFIFAILSALVGTGYLIAKLLFWKYFELGVAPAVVGLFFFGSVQLVALGVIGEYVGSIHTMVQNRPLVIEKERINFEETE